MKDATINLFTIGVNGKTPKLFFELLKENNIDLVIDIRINNKSQFAGFAKGGYEYLGYFLKKILNVEYKHDIYLAPTKDLLERYHKSYDWLYYQEAFNQIISERKIKEYFLNRYSTFHNICLLCAEATPEKCHRRLVAEAIFGEKAVKHL